MNNETVIAVRNLTVSYGQTRAVAGISFDVSRGEVFGLLGTNGAGKTTALDVLEGYRSPTTGSVAVFGVDPYKSRDKIATRMGIMLQESGFFETLTVAQTVRAWRRFYSHPRGLDEALDIVGLDNRADVRVSALSGGERRRLDLTLALLGHPELLFLDEPTTGMDPEGRRQCLDLIESMVVDGMTVVLTTHYLEEAERLANRVAIMHRGRIQRLGTLQDVIDDQGLATVRFTLRPGASEDLPALVSATRRPVAGGTEIQIRTGDPQRTLAPLLAWADARSVELQDLTITRSSLQDVFLSMADQEPTLEGAY